MENYKKIAEEVVEAVGGKSNIQENSTCMTRLHLTLADKSKVDLDRVKKIDGVMGTVDGEELQIVFGPGKVTKIGEEVSAITGISADERKEVHNEDLEKDIDLQARAKENKAAQQAKHNGPVQVFLKHFANIFLPALPGIAGAGLIYGILNVLKLFFRVPGIAAVQLDPEIAQSWWYLTLNTAGWTLFAYLPIYIGMNAAKEYKGSPILGGMMGAMFVGNAAMPLLMKVGDPAAGINLPITGAPFDAAAGGILAAVFGGIVIAHVERWLRSWVPDTLDMILTPLCSLIITAFLAIFILQPLGAVLTKAIFALADVLLNKLGFIGAYALSALQLPLVSVGLHRAFTPIHTIMNDPNGATHGVNYLLPILQVAGAGQVGAVIALFARAKKNHRKLSEAILASVPAGILGIGEPLMYGVTLPLGKPFLTASLGAGFGGIMISLFHVGSVAQGVSGILGFLIVNEGGALGYLVGYVTAIVAAFIITYFFGWNEEKVTELFG